MELGGDEGSLLPCHLPYVGSVVMEALAGLTILSFSSLGDFIVDPLDEPSTVSYRELIVVIPGHSEVVAQQEEGLQHHHRFIFRS